MALNANVLGDLMKAAVDGVSDPKDRTALFRAIAGAIVTHITTSGVVNTTVVGTSATGGPVTGTGTGAIT